MTMSSSSRVARGCEPADDGELGPVCADELDHRLRRPDLHIELDTRMGGVERRDGIHREIHPGAGRRDREPSGLGSRERPGAARGLRDERLGALDVVGHELARGGQADTAWSADDQLRPELGFKLRDVLRDGRLADDELFRCGREGPAARERCECP